MGVILWIVLAVAAAFVFVYFSARRARARRPPLQLPPGESMPTTPLQRLAQWTFAACGLLTLIAIAIVIYHGPQVYWDDDRVRLTVMALILAIIGLFSVTMMRAASWAARGDARLDEHDRAILAGAPAGQGGAMLVTLAVWQIGLTETFHGAGQVPVVFLYLTFWSCLIMALLSWLGGIVMGYRRN